MLIHWFPVVCWAHRNIRATGGFPTNCVTTIAGPIRIRLQIHLCSLLLETLVLVDTMGGVSLPPSNVKPEKLTWPGIQHWAVTVFKGFRSSPHHTDRSERLNLQSSLWRSSSAFQLHSAVCQDVKSRRGAFEDDIKQIWWATSSARHAGSLHVLPLIYFVFMQDLVSSSPVMKAAASCK